MSRSEMIFVAGSTGQIARALQSRAVCMGTALRAVGRPGLDLLNRSSIIATLDEIRPNVIINAAAYTAVDEAEADEAAALALNAEGAGALALAAADRGIPILHLSTDYVFDGRKRTPYSEADCAAPLGAYGRSKLAGELAVAESNPYHLILRTAWIYSPFGKNFVKTMLRLAQTREELSVVHDQTGNPTSANDIADALIVLAARIRVGDLIPWGVYHLAATGEASWAEFAEEIFAVSGTLGGPTARVRRISTSDYPTTAPRPENSRLDGSKLKDAFGIALPHWQASTQQCVEKLVKSATWTT